MRKLQNNFLAQKFCIKTIFNTPLEHCLRAQSLNKPIEELTEQERFNLEFVKDYIDQSKCTYFHWIVLPRRRNFFKKKFKILCRMINN